MLPLHHRDGPADRWPHARPGFILAAMAGICAVLVLILPVGTVIVLYQNGALTIGNVLKLGLLVLTAIVAVLSQPRPLMVVVAIPSVLIFVFSIVFLTAFAFRAAWGPRILAGLAMLWALSVNASTIVMPLMSFSGSLPVLTFLGMIPALIAPLVFSFGFVGFMIHGDVARAWFRTGPSEVRA